ALAFLLGGQAVSLDDRSNWAPDEAIEVEGEFVSLADQSEVVRVRAVLDAAGAKRVEALDHMHPSLDDKPENLTLPALREKISELDIPSPGGVVKQPFVDALSNWLAQQPENALEERWRVASRDEVSRLPSFTRFDSAEAPSPTSHIQTV